MKLEDPNKKLNIQKTLSNTPQMRLRNSSFKNLKYEKYILLGDSMAEGFEY